MRQVKRWAVFALTLAFALSLCAVSASAAEPFTETGAAYLPRNGENVCAAFVAQEDGISFQLNPAVTLVKDYAVRLYTAGAGAGKAVCDTVSVDVNRTVTFYGLTPGQQYYFTISSDSAPISGCNSIYTITGAAAPVDMGLERGGHSVTLYTSNRRSVAAEVYIGVGSAFTLPEAERYTGYDFTGWSVGGKVYQAGQQVPVEQDLQFTAQWTVSNPPRHPFTDVSESDSYFDGVMYVYENGIMAGTSGTEFGSGKTVTRAELWTVLARMNGVDTTGGSVWYEKAQQWAVSAGITDGAAPDRNVTRCEAITMLYRQAGNPEVANADNYARAFGDMDDVDSWAYDAVIWALQKNLLDIYYIGGMLHPGQGAARWELACLLTGYRKNP